MDEFAQSRGDDDLFDDEIVPIEATPQSVQDLTAQVEQVSLEQSPATIGQPESREAHNGSRGRGKGRGRGRGAPAREPIKQHDLAQSRFAPKSAPQRKEASKAPIKGPPSSESPVERNQTEPETETPPLDLDTSTTQQPPPQPPIGPSNPNPLASRPPAVRGDRTKTGGLTRPKLTEEELNAKLLAAKERSQTLSAAHARAQADAENFAAREKIATQKRVKETAERKVMEGERERNRERKLRGRGGREWDARKEDGDFASRGRGDRVRQGFGHEVGEEEQDLSMYEWHEDQHRGRGRGRGRDGRGGGRGRGRGGDGPGRGGISQQHLPQHQRQPDLQAEADFPALPGAATTRTEKNLKPMPKIDRQVSEVEVPAGTSWADQVESSEAQKAT